MSCFPFRRSVERLRDGLLDPIAVDRLTVEVDHLVGKFAQGLQNLERGRSAHLCICGSYGQGKSHSLQDLRKRALSLGYAVSMVQLDQREIPFPQFEIVYASLMEALTLPDGRTLVEAWQHSRHLHEGKVIERMPNRFQAILQGLLSRVQSVHLKGRKVQKPPLRPKEVKIALEQALMGRKVTSSYLKRALQACGITGYEAKKLACKGNDPYVKMVEALGELLQRMGYQGLVLFFDEAESMAGGRVSTRQKSYAVLQQFFESSAPIYSIFAVTESFFDRLRSEEYANPDHKFPRNYAEEWKDLRIASLRDLSSREWDLVQDRLIQLYADAYQIDLSQEVVEIKKKQKALLDRFLSQETRFKLKTLVYQLDTDTQKYFL